MSIGKKIQTLRRAMHITQRKLANHLNVTAQAVSKWENDLSYPDITLIVPIAQFFDITTDELLGL